MTGHFEFKWHSAAFSFPRSARPCSRALDNVLSGSGLSQSMVTSKLRYATNCATSAHCFFRVLHCIQSLSLCNKTTFQVYSAMNCWVLREIRSRRIVQDHSDMLECNMCQTFTSILGRFQIGPSTLLLPDAAECGTQFKPAACIHSICPRLKHMRKCR